MDIPKPEVSRKLEAIYNKKLIMANLLTRTYLKLGFVKPSQILTAKPFARRVRKTPSLPCPTYRTAELLKEIDFLAQFGYFVFISLNIYLKFIKYSKEGTNEYFCGSIRKQECS